jgi:hypothetical protein
VAHCRLYLNWHTADLYGTLQNLFTGHTADFNYWHTADFIYTGTLPTLFTGTLPTLFPGTLPTLFTGTLLTLFILKHCPFTGTHVLFGKQIECCKYGRAQQLNSTEVYYK